jgi:SAM-dependent methyltransferase
VDESETFAGLIRAHGRGAMKTLLNLGSGGGHNDWTLKHHFAVTGVDCSPEMQGLAGRLNPAVEYIAGDMREVRLEREFDAVVCCDSIDYMLSEADLAAAFATAYAHLRPGGVFLTYAEVTVESFVEGRVRAIRAVGDGGGDDGSEIIFIEHDHDPDPTDSTMECGYITLIRQAGLFRVEADHHLTGIFPEARWPALLEEAGFETKALTITVWDETEEPIPTFIAIKP